jgi:hypothetical protein
MGLGGVALGAFAFLVAQEERTHAELSRRVRGTSQAREGLSALITELSAVAPRGGDIPAGGAADSAIEFRATVGSFHACELRGQTMIATLASFVTAPQPGDTAWLYTDAEAASEWVPLPIVDVSLLSMSDEVACAGPTAPVSNRPAPRHRYAFALAQPPPPGIAALAAVRVTRHVRYSVYRAPGGGWYLGRREWSAAAGRFETVQPVSGPYAGYRALRYFDETGAELSSASTATDRIAKISVSLRAPHEWREVTPITIGLRNR